MHDHGSGERVVEFAEGNGDSSGHPALSTAASFVAFQSAAVNLVADDTNGKSDEFIRPFTAVSATVTNTATMDRVSGYERRALRRGAQRRDHAS